MGTILQLQAHFSLILGQSRQQRISFPKATNSVKVVLAKSTRYYIPTTYVFLYIPKLKLVENRFSLHVLVHEKAHFFLPENPSHTEFHEKAHFF